MRLGARPFESSNPDDQLAWLVLRVIAARALYLKKVSEGAVNNPCYFSMDATRPGGLERRFYIICEADRTFHAVPSGHGDGRNLEGVADFANGIRCAKNFSNAMDLQLTTGGPYVTAEIRTSFKGYYRDPAEIAWPSCDRSSNSMAKATRLTPGGAPSAAIRP